MRCSTINARFLISASEALFKRQTCPLISALKPSPNKRASQASSGINSWAREANLMNCSSYSATVPSPCSKLHSSRNFSSFNQLGKYLFSNNSLNFCHVTVTPSASKSVCITIHQENAASFRRKQAKETLCSSEHRIKSKIFSKIKIQR
uniref:Uncharacterized protein n=1 Tax=Cucumis sativus TaxID=3659 RepID=A0A0A0KYN9_CUCSA